MILELIKMFGKKIQLSTLIFILKPLLYATLEV